MQTFYANYLKLLQDCHDNVARALDGLPPAALDWVPGADTNSISVLVVHMAGAERFWIGDVAAQDSSNRDRAAEFKVHDLEVDFLKQRLTAAQDYATSALSNLEHQDLDTLRQLADGRQFTVAYALMHALEHSALHLGQIQLTRQLWEQQTG